MRIQREPKPRGLRHHVLNLNEVTDKGYTPFSMRPVATSSLHPAPKLLVALVVDEVLYLLRQISGHENAEEVSVGLEG